MKASAFRRWPVAGAYSPEQTTRLTGGSDFMPFSDKGNQIGIGFPYTYLYIQKQGVLHSSPFLSVGMNPLRLILNLFFLYLLLKFLSWSWCFLELNRKQN